MEECRSKLLDADLRKRMGQCSVDLGALWLSRKYWGKGIMTEAVFPITDYAFDVLGFERLFFSNAVGNEKSRRVKEKTGARFLRTEPGKFVNPSYTKRENLGID